MWRHCSIRSHLLKVAGHVHTNLNRKSHDGLNALAGGQDWSNLGELPLFELQSINTVPVCWWHNEDMPKILYAQVIKEDPHELEKLEKHHRYTHLFQRVRMLRLLKSGECSNLAEAADALGYSWRQ